MGRKKKTEKWQRKIKNRAASLYFNNIVKKLIRRKKRRKLVSAKRRRRRKAKRSEDTAVVAAVTPQVTMNLHRKRIRSTRWKNLKKLKKMEHDKKVQEER